MILHQYELDAIEHAKSCHPYESVGFVVNNEYIPLTNISDSPRSQFEVASKDYMRFPSPDRLIHSHPEMKALEPSRCDMQGQLDMNIPWGVFTINWLYEEKRFSVSPILYWGTGLPHPPLIGRKFRWGPSSISDNGGDCYALVKDYYEMEMGIILPEYPRDNEWWINGGDMYRDNFQNAGFRRIEMSEMRKGDVALAQIMSKVPNHAGIYLGDGTFLHHLTNRLSRRDNVNVYKKCVTHCLRYDPQ
jgi:proteasome lid subunit RPN8/RPN11